MDNSTFDDHGKISQLVIKKLNGTITAEEQQWLDDWLQADAGNQAVLNRLLDAQTVAGDLALMNSFDTAKMLENLSNRIAHEKKHRWPVVYKIAAVAAVLVIAFTITYTYYPKNIRSVQTAQTHKTTSPDTNGLYLTLADGTTIDLEQAGKGVVGKQGSALITKSGNGTLNYSIDNETPPAGDSVALNTLTVPKGKRFEMILPDGSHVWLNAQTTLTYLASFNATERTVTLNGEAYFEVARHAHWPFKVNTSHQVVQVLGTHFNVEAYADDNKTTTVLAEGKVRVHKGDESVDIKPGQMTVNSNAGAGITIQPADLEAALAWRKGLFYFKDERIEDMMKRIARNYDVEVQFKGDIKDKKFWVTYPMDKGLEHLLKNLEQTNIIHFELQQKKLIVTP